MNIARESNAIAIIALRDLLKCLRDRSRIIATFIFPILFIGALGGSLDANIDFGFDFITFVFTGVLGQTLFQSSASGVISLIEDRQNDFSMELFVSPISRYSIIIGKILGESLVAMTQAVGIIAFGIIIGVPVSLGFVLTMIPVGLFICFLGGAFGILVLSNLSSERAANQIFPFILFPQFFLAGVFNPIQQLPWYMDILSRIAPMRYAVDLVRNIYYAGFAEADMTVLSSATYNTIIITVMLAVFVLIGTILFVRNERNR